MFFHHLTAKSFDEVEGITLAPGVCMQRRFQPSYGWLLRLMIINISHSISFFVFNSSTKIVTLSVYTHTHTYTHNHTQLQLISLE